MVGARSLSAFPERFPESAANAFRHLDQEEGRWYERDQEREEINRFRDLIKNEASQRSRLGDRLYDAFFEMTRWRRAASPAVSCDPHLAAIGVALRRAEEDHRKSLPRDVGPDVPESALWMNVGELPTRPGDSCRLQAADRSFRGHLQANGTG